MMDRLTRKSKVGGYLLKEHLSIIHNTFSSQYNLAKIIEKLGKYEDAEEQGLLLRLPCKVGDVIWDNDYGVPTAYEITGYSFGESDGYIEYPASKTEIVFYYSNTSGSITGSFAVSEIGKTVFLTQAEAEQKLKEMESD